MLQQLLLHETVCILAHVKKELLIINFIIAQRNYRLSQVPLKHFTQFKKIAHVTVQNNPKHLQVTGQANYVFP